VIGHRAPLTPTKSNDSASAIAAFGDCLPIRLGGRLLEACPMSAAGHQLLLLSIETPATEWLVSAAHETLAKAGSAGAGSISSTFPVSWKLASGDDWLQQQRSLDSDPGQLFRRLEQVACWRLTSASRVFRRPTGTLCASSLRGSSRVFRPLLRLSVHQDCRAVNWQPEGGFRSATVSPCFVAIGHAVLLMPPGWQHEKVVD